MESSLKEKTKKMNNAENVILTRKDALTFIYKKFGGKKRKDGTAVLSHPVETAKVLINFFPNEPERLNTILDIALLHDVLEDTDTTYDELKEKFGEKVANGVKALTHENGLSKTGKKAEVLLDQMLQMEPDVLLVKLADRLHNVRTLNTMREDKGMQTIDDTIYIIKGLKESYPNLSVEDKMLIRTIEYSLKEHEMGRTSRGYF